MSLAPESLMMQNPDFIGIGSRRCGSSWLHGLLSQHPDIVKPAGGVHFFTENWDKGLKFYHSNFEKNHENQVSVDLSVSYTYPNHAEETAALIASTCPEAQVFVLLRDPIERTFSDYRRSIMLFELPVKTSLKDAVNLDPELLTRSFYYKNLAPYWEQGIDVRIFDFNQLSLNESVFMNALGRYFNVDPAPLKLSTKKSLKGSAVLPRNALLAKSIFWAKSFFRRLARFVGLERIWDQFTMIAQPLYQKFLQKNGQKIELTQEDREFLAACFKDDMAQLRAKTQMDFPNWSV